MRKLLFRYIILLNIESGWRD